MRKKKIIPLNRCIFSTNLKNEREREKSKKKKNHNKSKKDSRKKDEVKIIVTDEKHKNKEKMVVEEKKTEKEDKKMEEKQRLLSIDNPFPLKESALIFMKDYEKVSESVTLMLRNLKAVKPSLLSNMAENIIQRYDKILQEESETYPSSIVNERYGNYTDILAYIFRQGLIPISELNDSRVIIKSVLFVMHYEELEKKMKGKGYLCYEYELLRSMVKSWSESFKEQSKGLRGEKAQLNRENTLSKLAEWVEKSKKQ
mgnify:CR=1 FL=1